MINAIVVKENMGKVSIKAIENTEEIYLELGFRDGQRRSLASKKLSVKIENNHIEVGYRKGDQWRRIKVPMFNDTVGQP